MVLHYVTTCFKCVIISRNKYSFLSKQSVTSVCKRAGILSLNRISELVWDSQSYDTGAPRDNNSEDKGGFEDEPGVSHLQPDQPTSTGNSSSSSFSSNASDEGEIFQSEPGQQVQTPSTLQWTWLPGHQRSVGHAFTGGPRGHKGNPAQHIKWRLQYT
jgi:hypothetical protein